MPSAAYGIPTTVVGMGGVFAVLFVLMIVVKVLDMVVDSIEGNSKKRKAEKHASQVAAQAAATPAPSVEDGINPKTVAAIMGAVSAASGRPRANLKFTAIRRSSSSFNWSTSGTNEIINTRQQYL